MTDLSRLTDRLLQLARKAGADSADAIAVQGEASHIALRQGALEQAERSEDVEVGLRVLIGRRQACVSASDLSDRTFEALAERAVAMAREAPEDATAGLADPGQLSDRRDDAGLDLFDAAGIPDPDRMLDRARAIEAAALRPGITQVEVSVSASRRDVHMQATNGFAAGMARSWHSLSAVAFTGEGTAMERDYAGEMRVHDADLPPEAEIGALAAERALARAGAVKPRTGHFPVVFDERVAASLIGHLLGAINGTAVARGSSFLRDAMGEPVLPAGLDLVEEPHLRRHPSSRHFDAEGLATGRRALVDDGVLRSFVLDLATGRKLGMASTANASRGMASPPSPATTNLVLTPGKRDRAALLAEMGTGLLVTSLIGATINPTTGDYSRGASGFWVEGGEVRHPVNECTIAGNLRDMLGRIRPANDARAFRSMAVPSLLVEGMTLAGA